MKKILPLLVLMFAASVFPQSELPEIGKIDEIKGKTKIYLFSDAINIKSMQQELSKLKNITIADKPENADFFIEYKVLKTDYVTDFHFPVETGQLDVYFYREKKKVVVWSKGEGKSMKPPTVELLKKFLKDFAK